MGQWINLLPWFSFLAGLGGSLHCLGMCGGLVTSSCHNRSEIFRYQLGRLLGYLLMGIIAAWIGSLFKQVIISSYLSLIPPLFIGGLFIFWGLQSYFGKHARFFRFKFLGQSYQVLWNKINLNKYLISKSFFVGLISILLPCGLIYGVILGGLGLQNVKFAILSIFFFWLGTLPSMVLAPEIVRKVFMPLQRLRPKLYAFALVLIGILTISYRIHEQIMLKNNIGEACHDILK